MFLVAVELLSQAELSKPYLLDDIWLVLFLVEYSVEYNYGMSSKEQIRPNSYLPVDVGVRPQSG